MYRRKEENDFTTFFNPNTTMHVRISDTFTDSLAKLTGDEQKAVKAMKTDSKTMVGKIIAEEGVWHAD